MKPPKLKHGDRIGIVAPSSPAADPGEIGRGTKALMNIGFEVVQGKGVNRRNRYLAGTDEERAEELNQMFADPTIKGIVCLRGGYGASRILRLIDYASIKRNPKVFIGYSDITALHLAIHKETEMFTFYGPMVVTEMAGRFSDYTRTCLLNVLTSNEPAEKINPRGREVQVIGEGVASGVLIGGYLPAIAASMGTPYEIDTRGRILFFEDFKKEPFELDRLLTQLLLSGKLKEAAGIAIGECVECEPKGRFPSSFSWEEVLRDRLENLGIPVLSGLCFGHGDHKATLPIGAKAVLNTAGMFLEIVESAVTQ
ncbi:MAG: LD-carboxypeptidase [Thermodesulfobacteriota bacterium]|jgi:muramoyltetrapeptide carboxypeptidase